MAMCSGKLLYACALFGALILASSASATAASLVNLDKQPHTITIEEGEKSREITVQPEEKLSGLCATECFLAIKGDPDTYQVVGNDEISIEEGQIYFQTDEDDSDDGEDDLTDDDGGEESDPDQ